MYQQETGDIYQEFNFFNQIDKLKILESKFLQQLDLASLSAVRVTKIPDWSDPGFPGSREKNQTFGTRFQIPDSRDSGIRD